MATSAISPTSVIFWALFSAVICWEMELTSQGRNELRIQLDSAEAKTIDEEGSILFRVNSTVIASVNVRVPVEARYSDVDTEPLVGPFVRIPLHVVVGTLFELEIYKDDRFPIIKKPGLEDLTLFLPSNGPEPADAGVSFES